MINIALAEDNSFLANSLVRKLELFDDFKVSFLAYHGKDLLLKLQEDSQVDVILMDIQMPEMNGIEAAQNVIQLYPQIKIIMLTIIDDEQAIYEAIQSGAVGYLMKESSPQEIFDGIQEALKGGAALSPAVALKAMKIIQNPDRVQRETVDYHLSARELEVLAQLSKGLGHKKIAINLSISPNTVRRHMDNIYKKMSVNNKVEAIQIAYRDKLI